MTGEEAQRLRVGPDTIRRFLRYKNLDGARIGGEWRIPAEASRQVYVPAGAILQEQACYGRGETAPFQPGVGRANVAVLVVDPKRWTNSCQALSGFNRRLGRSGQQKLRILGARDSSANRRGVQRIWRDSNTTAYTDLWDKL